MFADPTECPFPQHFFAMMSFRTGTFPTGAAPARQDLQGKTTAQTVIRATIKPCLLQELWPPLPLFISDSQKGQKAGRTPCLPTFGSSHVPVFNISLLQNKPQAGKGTQWPKNQRRQRITRGEKSCTDESPAAKTTTSQTHTFHG